MSSKRKLCDEVALMEYNDRPLRKRYLSELATYPSLTRVESLLSVHRRLSSALSIATSCRMLEYQYQDPLMFARNTTIKKILLSNAFESPSLPSLADVVAAGAGAEFSSPVLGINQTVPDSKLSIYSGIDNSFDFLRPYRLSYHQSEILLRQKALQLAATARQQPLSTNLVSTRATLGQSLIRTKVGTMRSETHTPLTHRLERTLDLPDQSNESYLPLGISEDQNWLSEFHCFVRDKLVVVCKINVQDSCTGTSEKMRVIPSQVGIRCRYCVHNFRESNTKRCSAFPSSIAQIYHSFTMMVRDHFGTCPQIPSPLKEKFLRLKGKTWQGCVDVKTYWQYSAEKLGFQDSEESIIITERSKIAGEKLPFFRSNPSTSNEKEKSPSIQLMESQDRKLTPFLYALMSQSQRIELSPSEHRRNRGRRSLPVGLPGFGCWYCCQFGWYGQSRVFPIKRRSLERKVKDLYNHLCRCTLCPLEIKILLRDLKEKELMMATDSSSASVRIFMQHERRFFHAMWIKLKGENIINPLIRSTDSVESATDLS